LFSAFRISISITNSQVHKNTWLVAVTQCWLLIYIATGWVTMQYIYFFQFTVSKTAWIASWIFPVFLLVLMHSEYWATKHSSWAVFVLQRLSL